MATTICLGVSLQFNFSYLLLLISEWLYNSYSTQMAMIAFSSRRIVPIFLLLFGLAARADPAIVTSVFQSVESSLRVTTSQVQFKAATNATRIDWSPLLTVLSWSDRPEIVEVHHDDQSYVRNAKGTSAEGAATALPLTVNWKASSWRGNPSELLVWTNGALSGSLEVTQPDLVAQGWSFPDAPVLPPTPAVMVGTPLSSNRVVIRTVVTNSVIVPVSSLGITSSSGTTNLMYRIVHELVSVTFTNLPRSEFEIPPGYREVSTYAPPPPVPPAAVFGIDPGGIGAAQARQQQIHDGSGVRIPASLPPLPPRLDVPKP